MEYWIEPKTDWKVEYDENGNYIGDYLNAKDLNRMSNNVSYLIRECKSLYETKGLFDDVPSYTATIGEILDINPLLTLVYTIQAINRFVRSKEVKDIINTSVLNISQNSQTPTWEFYNAVERITKLEHEQMVKVANDKRKLKYQFGIPNTGGF